ncbi:uncharacterized protein LOC143231454 [Tachypleus tridentatus]|uniref:uncharacterized protein LOC143231454 n=1 Tax=Tachypleus tridentatus TaxID=6853 RepID=UPI003FCFC3C9
MSLNLKGLILVALFIGSCVTERKEEQTDQRVTSRRERQLLPRYYPHSYTQYFGQYPYLWSTYYNYYQRPSLTDRLRNFMSNIFRRRSYPQQYYFSPTSSYYYRPANQPLYYTSKANNVVQVPYQRNKYYKVANTFPTNNLDSPQHGQYKPISLSKSGANYDFNAIKQLKVSDNTYNIVGQSDQTQSSGSGYSGSVKVPKKAILYSSTFAPYPAWSSYTIDDSQPYNPHVNTYEASSLDFHPVATPSISNHSPVYKKPLVYGHKK